MTTIVTADLHLAENPRDAYRFQFLEHTLPALVEEHQATRVLVLGDLTESKDSHRAALVNRLVDGFATLAEQVDVYVLRGNHDYVAEDVPYYRFLRHLERVRWIGEPTALKLRGLGACLFLPHTPHPTEDWLEISPDDDYKWVFCHQTFKGSDLGHGHITNGGTEWDYVFSKKSRVVSGDVHVPQKVGPVTYVGSPFLVDFGDSFAPRVLVLDGDKMVSVPVPGPQKVLITLDHPHQSYPNNVLAGDVVKIRVELPAGSEASRTDIRTSARAWAAEAGVELYAVEIVAPPGARTEGAAGIPQHRTDDQLVRAYAKKMGQGKTSVAVGLKIAEETP